MTHRELKSIHIVVVVFGQTYSELLTSVTLYNLASMVREIPDVLRATSKVRIFSTEDDIPGIENSPSFALLRKEIATELLDRAAVAGFEQHGDYGPMVLTQRVAVEEASREGAALFFVGPDQIYNQGAFASFVERLRQGYRVIVGPGPRILRDMVRPALMAEIARSADGSFALSPERQAKALFRFWHPINDQFWIGSEKGIYWKAYLYFRPRPTELFLRFFQGPTFVAWPNRALEKFDGYIDLEIIRCCCETAREAYIVEDGAECLALDLTADERRDEGMPVSAFPKVDLFKQLLKRMAVNDMQLRYGLRTCHVHLGDSNDDDRRHWRRQFSKAVDPLVVIAIFARTIEDRLGRWIAIAFKAASTLSINTLTFLIAPAVPWLVRSEKKDS
jgi:hypothetical protein